MQMPFFRKTLAASVKRCVDRDRICEQLSIRNNNLSSIVGLDRGGSGLNGLHGSFVIIQLDLVSDSKWFCPEQQQACEKILQYILKCKPDGNTTDAKNLYQISSLKRRSDNGERYQQPEEDDGRSSQSCEHNAKVSAICPSRTMNYTADYDASEVKDLGS